MDKIRRLETKLVETKIRGENSCEKCIMAIQVL